MNNFYDRIPTSVERSGYNHEKIAFILDNSGTNRNILDIGCNDGYIGSLLIKQGNVVSGIDIAKKKVLAAGKKKVLARVVDITTTPQPYPKNSFDIILLTDVIEHVFDTDSVLLGIKSMLKPGGRLILTTPNVASLGRRIMLLLGMNPFLEYSPRFLSAYAPPVGHIRYYTRQTLEEQLTRLGFKNIQIHGDMVNFVFIASHFLGKLIPGLAINFHCICTK